MKLIKVTEFFRIGSGVHPLKNIYMYMYLLGKENSRGQHYPHYAQLCFQNFSVAK